MSLYPEGIIRCQHIKINGTQCGSPALRNEKHCFFHTQWTRKTRDIDVETHEAQWNITLALMEDANSIQMGLGEVMRMLVSKTLDFRTAGLLLYALQTASANLKHTSFEPEPTLVVIDPESVERRPIGATAWSKFRGREYDDAADKDIDISKKGDDNDYTDSFLKFLIASRLTHNPGFLDEWVGNHGGEAGQQLAERLHSSSPGGESEERVRDQ